MAYCTMNDKINFIRSIIKDVAHVSNETGISMDFILAQIALETGWGAKVLPGPNNLFNIKAGSSWEGEIATFKVKEYVKGKWVYEESDFRVYDSYKESIEDWLNFLQNNPRYSNVFDPDVKGDLKKIAKAMKDAGYATDPKYAQKIIATAKGPTMRNALYYYDNACHMDPYGLTRNGFTTATTTKSPITIDLDNDGIETMSLADGAYFDHDANGFSEQTGWVSGDDGFLVMDRNNDGIINDGKELFGDQTILSNGQKASNGFQALSELDENKDGKIDVNDAAYSQLKVWSDVDGDGYSSEDELLSLSDAGIQSINTGYSNSTTVDEQGNEHKQVGSFTKADGTTGSASDVYFQTDNMYTIANEWVDVPEDIAELPDLQGYGNVYDLQQAMAREALSSQQSAVSLKNLVEQFMNETNSEVRHSLITQIIYKWAGVENVDPLSRAATKIYGNVIGDARKLATLEAFVGEAYLGTWCWGERDPNPHGPASKILLRARALLTNPRLLIFDEATSALDYESESIIQRNMKKMCHGRTVIIIAHRLSTLRNADKIMVIDKGELIESGSHEELMKQEGLYHYMYSKQAIGDGQ